MTQLDTYLPPWLREFLPQDHPVLVAGLTLLALFLWLRIGALLVGLARSRRAAQVPGNEDIDARQCLWEPDSRPAPWGRTRWRCASCGGVALSQDDQPPRSCQRRP